MALGGAPAIEALVPREPCRNTDENDGQPETEADESPIVRLLRREGYTEDLNLGEGTHARLLQVLHASMRDVSIAPLSDAEADDEEEDSGEPENTEPHEQPKLGAST